MDGNASRPIADFPKDSAGRFTSDSVADFKILCRRFALVRDLFVFDNLPLIQAAEASFLHHRNVNEPPPCELNHFTVPRAISESPNLTIKDTVANVKCQLTAEAA